MRALIRVIPNGALLTCICCGKGAGLKRVMDLEKVKAAAGKTSHPKEHLLELEMHAQDLEKEIRRDQALLRKVKWEASLLPQNQVRHLHAGGSKRSQETRINQERRTTAFAQSEGNLAMHCGLHMKGKDDGDFGASFEKKHLFRTDAPKEENPLPHDGHQHKESGQHSHHSKEHGHHAGRNHLHSSGFSSSEAKIAHMEARVEAGRNLQETCERLERLEGRQWSKAAPIRKDESHDVHKHVRTLQGVWLSEKVWHGVEDHHHKGK